MNYRQRQPATSGGFGHNGHRFEIIGRRGFSLVVEGDRTLVAALPPCGSAVEAVGMVRRGDFKIPAYLIKRAEDRAALAGVEPGVWVCGCVESEGNRLHGFVRCHCGAPCPELARAGRSCEPLPHERLK